MEHRIEVAPRVYDDLDEICSYITEHSSPQTAARWHEQIIQKMRSLNKFPLRCPIAPEAKHGKREFRHTFAGEYRIIFYVEEATVRVVHVRHGKRRPAKRGKI